MLSACLYQRSKTHGSSYYLVDENQRTRELRYPKEAESFLNVFREFRYIITVDAYTTLFRDLYHVEGKHRAKNQDLITNYEDTWYFPTTLNNVVDMVAVSSFLGDRSMLHGEVAEAQFAALRGEDVFYGAGLLEALESVRALYHDVSKMHFVHNFAIAPISMGRTLLLDYNGPIRVDRTVRQPRRLASVVSEKLPIVPNKKSADRIVVVWYSYPIKYKYISSLGTSDTLRIERVFSGGNRLTVFTEQLVDGALRFENLQYLGGTVVDDVTRHLEETAKRVDDESCQLVSLHHDFMITSHLGNYESDLEAIRTEMSHKMQADMRYKYVFTHFFEFAYGKWVGFWMSRGKNARKEAPTVVLHGLGDEFQPERVSHYYLSLLAGRTHRKQQQKKNRASDENDMPNCLIYHDPSRHERFRRTARIGYETAEYEEADWIEYNALYDESYLIEKALHTQTDRRAYEIQVDNFMNQHAIRNYYSYKAAKRCRNPCVYTVQCEPCLRLGSVISRLSKGVGEGECEHAFVKERVKESTPGHFILKRREQAAADLESACSVCKEVHRMTQESQTCSLHKYMKWIPSHARYTPSNKLLPKDGFPVCGAVDDNLKRIMIAVYSSADTLLMLPDCLLKRSAIMPDSNTVPHCNLVVQQSDADGLKAILSVLFMEGYLEDCDANLSLVTPQHDKTSVVVHFVGYGFVEFSETRAELYRNPVHLCRAMEQRKY